MSNIFKSSLFEFQNIFSLSFIIESIILLAKRQGETDDNKILPSANEQNLV